MGAWADALIYATMIADEVQKNPCERNGVDQGMHNYYVYSGACCVEVVGTVGASGAAQLVGAPLRSPIPPPTRPTPQATLRRPSPP